MCLDNSDLHILEAGRCVIREETWIDHSATVRGEMER